jgi:hypothetical protein
LMSLNLLLTIVDPSYTPNHFPTCDQPPSIPTNTNQKSEFKEWG